MDKSLKKPKKPPVIHTIASLHRHLQWALEVEHFTIPPYLCALWSIKEGTNQDSAKLIHSVVMEEMLHMTLVANLMNAVGATPQIDRPGFIPTYGSTMPHSGADLRVSLEKFSPSAVSTFMEIEQPKKTGAPPQPDHFHTIAQLYDAIAEGLQYLAKEKKGRNIFVGKKHHQVTPEYYYGGGGFVYAIENLDQAMLAIREISEQGEGKVPSKKGAPASIFDGDEHFGQPPELAHFYRFKEIRYGKKYGEKPDLNKIPDGPKFKVSWKDVYPMQKNPRVKPYPQGTPIRKKMDAFNRCYTRMLQMIERAFQGQPELLQDAVGEMYKLKYQGIELMMIPSGKGSTTVGPSFEYLP